MQPSLSEVGNTTTSTLSNAITNWDDKSQLHVSDFLNFTTTRWCIMGYLAISLPLTEPALLGQSYTPQTYVIMHCRRRRLRAVSAASGPLSSWRHTSAGSGSSRILLHGRGYAETLPVPAAKTSPTAMQHRQQTTV